MHGLPGLPSLEVLQEHVQNGIREASAAVFHLTMAQLTGNVNQRTPLEEEVSTRRRTRTGGRRSREGEGE